ncbi:MAG: glycosyltransferase family 4 protein [Hyphomicrobium sp.]|nr:glycosyltransferase family 4 protein [Hyphomicrobium sp.]
MPASSAKWSPPELSLAFPDITPRADVGLAAVHRGTRQAPLSSDIVQARSADASRVAPQTTLPRQRVLFLYWGRRGLSEFSLMLADAARARSDIEAFFTVSRQNEKFSDFEMLGECMEPVTTFESNLGALLSIARVNKARSQILKRLRRDRIDTVVSLMPHVWSPLIAPAIRAAGVKFVSIIHDAEPHPGDLKSWVASWAFRDLVHSDLVLTLSEHVTKSLHDSDTVDPSIVRTLFHPNLRFAESVRPDWPTPSEPFRVLFLGRILPYKGLALLIDAIEGLRARGVNLALGVFGDGAIAPYMERLKGLGAEVENRWLSTEEMSAALNRYHAVALSHTEASQSGIAALAAGHGVPVVANPVGGLVEQIVDGQSGVMAAMPTAAAFGDALAKLAGDRQLYDGIAASLQADYKQKSFSAFLSSILACIHETTGYAQGVAKVGGNM